MISCLRLIQTLDNLKGSHEKNSLDITNHSMVRFEGEKMTDI